MGVKISELAEVDTVANSDIIPIVQGNTTKKTTITKLHSNITATKISLGERTSGSTEGTFSITQGSYNTASASRTLAQGYYAIATNNSAAAMGEYATASGKASHALGFGSSNAIVSATGDGAFAYGQAISATNYATGPITASGNGSLAGGRTYIGGQLKTGASIQASNHGAVAIGAASDGGMIKATKSGSTAIGYAARQKNIEANGEGSFAGGITQGVGAVTAGGSGSFSYGFSTNANGNYMTAIGRLNAAGTSISSQTATTGDVFIIGKGTADNARSNCFRVTIAGATYGVGAFNTSGADYAEMTEWQDGNPEAEDRVGKFVCMTGEKMRIANSHDVRSRIGVVSSEPTVVGDTHSEEWKGKYKTDIFGRKLTRVVQVPEQRDDDGNVIQEACETTEWIEAEDFDNDREYTPREQRKEFGYFGMLGKVVVIDDGSCQEDGYCYPNDNGIATNENDSNKGFYVMERLDNSHIRILLK